MLTTLNLEGTSETPKVIFNIESSSMTIEGVSIPLVASNFYSELIKLLSEHLLTNPKKLTFNCTLEYFNTGTSRCLLLLFNMLMRYKEAYDIDLVINWYYCDEDILECGQDYAFMTSLDFNLISLN